MALLIADIDNMVRVSAQANTNAPAFWTFVPTHFDDTTADTIEECLVLGYFNLMIASLFVGDVIYIYSAGTLSAVQVTSVTDNVAVELMTGEQTVVADYDFAVDGGAIGQIGLGVWIPDNARIISAHYEVGTALLPATGTTVSLDSLATGDLTAAVILGTVFAAGVYAECIPKIEDPATSIKMTSLKEISMSILVGAVTAGTFRVVVKYIQGL